MLVISYCSVALIWLTDICAVVMCLDDEDGRDGEEGTSNYIQQKFDVRPWLYS